MPNTFLFQWAVADTEVSVPDTSEARIQLSADHPEGYTERQPISNSPGPQIGIGEGGAGNPDSITLTDTYT